MMNLLLKVPGTLSVRSKVPGTLSGALSVIALIGEL